MQRQILPRLQRIFAAIEIFALVLWVGGLFFVAVFASPTVNQALGSDPDRAIRVVQKLHARFNSVELIFAVVVLASNFLKGAVLGNLSRLQRYALLASSLMLVLTLSYSLHLKPKIEDKLSEITAMTATATSRDQQKLEVTIRKYRILMGLNLALGLFMVYAYRSFEERKMAAVAQFLKDQQG